MAILQRGCCCTLRTCVCVLGWITLICSIIGVAISIYRGSIDCEEIANELRRVATFDYNDFIDKCQNAKNLFWVQVVFFLIMFICALLLLIGVKKENRFLLIPYIVAQCLTLLYSVINIAFQGADMGFNTTVILFLVIFLLCVALSVYCILCVISLYQNLRDGVDVSGGGGPAKA